MTTSRCDAAASSLEQEGYQVLEAQDGEACLATYQHCQLDAILLDAVMPVMMVLPVAANCGPSLGRAHACVDGTA